MKQVNWKFTIHQSIYNHIFSNKLLQKRLIRQLNADQQFDKLPNKTQQFMCKIALSQTRSRNAGHKQSASNAQATELIVITLYERLAKTPSSFTPFCKTSSLHEPAPNASYKRALALQLGTAYEPPHQKDKQHTPTHKNVLPVPVLCYPPMINGIALTMSKNDKLCLRS